jgi:DNA-binding transcriptional MerR regulator
VNLPRDNRAPPVKLYYRIGEVAELVGVEPYVLRYWETEFPTIRPQKSRSGQRVYSRRDVEKLLRVKDLLYAQRFTIAGARQRLRGTAPESGLSASASSAELPTQGQSHGERASVGASVEGAPTYVRSSANDGTRAAATALRSALLAVREQVAEMLAQIDRGASGSDS